jgi:hypothetical protein
MTRGGRAPGGAARLALVLVPGTLEATTLDGARARLPLVHHGYPREAGALALLGQEAASAWSGPAAFAAAASGRALRPSETAWLLEPVRVASDGGSVIEGPLRLGAAALADVLEHLAAALEQSGSPLELVAGEPTTLVLPEGLADQPSTAIAELLQGRPLETFWEGHEALEPVVRASQQACRDAGGPATHLVPHSPAGPLRVRPLREVWPQVRSAAIVGGAPAARALAVLLGLTPLSAAPGQELAVAAEAAREHEVVIAYLGDATFDPADLSALDGAAQVLVVAGEPDAEGTLELVVRGASAPVEGGDPLRALVC